MVRFDVGMRARLLRFATRSGTDVEGQARHCLAGIARWTESEFGRLRKPPSVTGAICRREMRACGDDSTQGLNSRCGPCVECPRLKSRSKARIKGCESGTLDCGGGRQQRRRRRQQQQRKSYWAVCIVNSCQTACIATQASVKPRVSMGSHSRRMYPGM